MEDDDVVNVRFAIVRFRTPDESARLRLLLRQHGYEEPTWLDNCGQQVQLPPLLMEDGERDEDIEIDVAEDRESPATPAAVGGPGMSPFGANITTFLTLPTVLVDTSSPRPTLATASSVILPLASVVTRSPPPTSSHASSRLSAYASNRPSTSECTPSTSHETTPPPPPASPEQPPLLVAVEGAAAAAAAIEDQPGPSGIATASGGSVSIAAKAWVSPAPLRPRGKKPIPHEDPNVYYTCELCKNRILGTRVSNLQNHVRRHSTLKQFQCCYCEYAHNEIAKVRLHMTNNHKDSESQPINNLTSDMQSVWRSLFRECFPTRAQRRRGMRQSTTACGAEAGAGAAAGAQAGPSGAGASTITSGTAGHSFGTTSSSTSLSSSQSGSQLPLSLRRRRLLRSRSNYHKQNRILRRNHLRSTTNRRQGDRTKRITDDGNDCPKRDDDDATRTLGIEVFSLLFGLYSDCLLGSRKTHPEQAEISLLLAGPSFCKSEQWTMCSDYVNAVMKIRPSLTINNDFAFRTGPTTCGG